MFELTLAAFAECRPEAGQEPVVLRIETGRLRLWRMDRGRRSEIEAGPGTILRIGAGEDFGYANAGEETLRLIVTAAANSCFDRPLQRSPSLAA